MKIHQPPRLLLESLILSLLPVCANAFFPADPLFLTIYSLPYLLTGAIFAAFNGLLWGLVPFVLAPAWGLVAAYFQGGAARIDSLLAHPTQLVVAAALGVISLLLAGLTRNLLRQAKQLILRHFKKLVVNSVREQRKSELLERVNAVLENRVSGQQDSLTLLRNQVKKLAALNLEEAMETLLETLALFSGLQAVSLWTPNEAGRHLILRKFEGQPLQPRPEILDLENSVEGYVFRNSSLFSVRMVLESLEFQNLDTRRCIMAFPIRDRGRVWAVISVEELPFERYSLYTEGLLEILLSLAEPYLSASLAHEARFDAREVDPDTSLPLFSQLVRTLEETLAHDGRTDSKVSLIVLEVVNFDEIGQTNNRADIKRLFLTIHQAFQSRNHLTVPAFIFKEERQLALLVRGRDQDGVSFLCLDLLSSLNDLDLKIANRPVSLEAIVGFGLASAAETNPLSLVEDAENLLLMQRL